MCPSHSLSNPNLPGPSPATRPVFDIIDRDQDGRISHNDLRQFFSPFPEASDDVITAMISAADADRNGFVEFEEFERILPEADSAEGVMGAAFRTMDGDGDGRVGVEDLKGYLRSVGMTLDEEEVREMICLGGCNEKSGVGFHDFMRILAVHFGPA